MGGDGAVERALGLSPRRGEGRGVTQRHGKDLARHAGHEEVEAEHDTGHLFAHLEPQPRLVEELRVLVAAAARRADEHLQCNGNQSEPSRMGTYLQYNGKEQCSGRSPAV